MWSVPVGKGSPGHMWTAQTRSDSKLYMSSATGEGVSEAHVDIAALIRLRTHSITKTCLYNFDPLEPHFYIVKLGFTGVYIIFLISAQNTDCRYSLEPPRRGGSNGYPQSMFWAEIWKISEFFYLKIFFFFEVKFSIDLNRRVFVMVWSGPPLSTFRIADTVEYICL